MSLVFKDFNRLETGIPYLESDCCSVCLFTVMPSEKSNWNTKDNGQGHPCF